MNKKKEKEYSNLDTSFEEEKKSIEKKSRSMMDALENIYHNKRRFSMKKHIKHSITIPESDSYFVTSLRSKIADPQNDFYPTKSDIFRAGIENLKKLTPEEVLKLVKSF